MADQKISDLTAAEAATADDLIVLVDDPSGTPVTKKLTIAELATAVAGDKLPLAGGTMTGAIMFGTGSQNINVGSFDNSTGGSSGISLVCAVGYELNWQGGHISNTYSSTNYAILCDSSITLAATKRITFGDATYLDSKLPVIVDDATVSGTLATNAATCDIVDCEFSGTAMIGNPTNSADGQTILWRISRTGGAQTVTLDSDFVIVSGTIDNTADYRTFVRATYDGSKWFADVTNAEVLPPPPAFTVSLLLHMDGADASTTFTDSSANALTVTPYSGAVISTAQSMFGGASGYFDSASAGYLLTADLPEFGFGTGDFAIEMWVQLTASGGRYGVLSVGDYTNGILWRLKDVGGSLYLAGNLMPWLTTNNPSGVPEDGMWHHIALTREGTMVRGFIDGAIDFEAYAGVIDLGASRPLMVGCGSHDLTTTESYRGYIDNVKITKGAAVYTAAFTPSTASLLLHMDASPFVDSSPVGRAVTMNGGVTLGAPKYGAGSCAFDGGSSCLSVTMDDMDWEMDWTIEFWMNATVTGNSGTPIAIGSLNSGIGGIHLCIQGNQLAWSDGISEFLTGGLVVEGVWTHVAMVRLSGVNYFYQDGVLIASGERTFPVVDLVATIGSAPNYGLGFIGTLDDVRIVKGQALYSGSNFTPPAGPLV